MSSKVVIVTGVSRGIGAAIVKKLLNENAVVIGVSRSKEPLEALAAGQGNFRYVIGDVTDSSVNEKLVEIATEYNSLDGIVFNAGVLEPVAKLADADVTEWKRLYDVNFFSVLTLLKLAIPTLRTSKGKVVFISSGAASGFYQGWGAYGSSKAALAHLAGTLAIEEPAIQSLALAPGVVDTEMQTNIRSLHGTTMHETHHQKFVSLKQSGDLLSPEVPGNLTANLILRGWSSDVNGKPLRYNAPELSSYLKD